MHHDQQLHCPCTGLGVRHDRMQIGIAVGVQKEVLFPWDVYSLSLDSILHELFVFFFDSVTLL